MSLQIYHISHYIFFLNDNSVNIELCFKYLSFNFQGLFAKLSIDNYI